jgi:hypothetical protein
MARTAVVAGTATSVSNRVSRRQAQRWAEQDAPSPYEQEQQAPPPPAEGSRIAQLQQLAELKSQGVLTEEEFAAEKARILG